MNGDYGLVYKANFLDPAVNVPLIVVAPRLSEGWVNQTRSSAMVELMDVGATLADYAGAGQSNLTRARSLRPMMERRVSSHRQFAVSEFAGHTCVVDDLLKVEFDPSLQPVLAFDREADPEEQANVVRNALYQSQIAARRDAVAAFRAATPPPVSS
jgi:arylsulfatase A-like enzyme